MKPGPKSRLTDELKSKILTLHANNPFFSRREIARKLHIKPATLQGYSKLLNLSFKSKNRAKLNHDFFENIDTEEKAYWLGFITADGNVSSTGKSIRIMLQKTDFHHLEKFRQAVNSSVRITFSERKSASSDKRVYSCLIVLSSEKMRTDLISKGIIPNKTQFCYPYDFSDHPELERHYWRGLVDGDGSLSISILSRLDRFKNNIKHIALNLNGTKKICEGFQSFCRKYTDSKSKLWYTKGKTKNSIGSWRFNTSRRLSLIVAHLLYKDSTIYLDRKYQKYLDFCEIMKGASYWEDSLKPFNSLMQSRPIL